MTYTISVTQRHIDSGIPLDCHCCPLAYAIRDALDLHFYPRVWDNAGTACVSFEKLEKVKGTYDLPLVCWTFMCDFDKKQRVRPFTFTLEIP